LIKSRTVTAARGSRAALGSRERLVRTLPAAAARGVVRDGADARARFPGFTLFLRRLLRLLWDNS